MIIYTTSASRYFPYIKDKFREKYKGIGYSAEFINCDSDTEWQGFHLGCGKDPEYITSADSIADAYRERRALKHINGKNYHYFDSEIRDNYELIYGILDVERVYKEPGDYIFSTIMHPIDKVYENYYYIWHILNVKGLHNIPGHDAKYFRDLLIAQGGGDTLEHFIDVFIEYKGLIKFFGNSTWCRSAAIQTATADGSCDFVGVVDNPINILKTFRFLNSKFGVELQISDALPRYKKIEEYCSQNTYRRRELEKIFERELYDYYAIKHKYGFLK